VAAVLELSLWVAERPASKAAEDDATPDFSGAKHNVIDLISEGLKRKKLPLTGREAVWKIIDLLSDDELGSPSHKLLVTICRHSRSDLRGRGYWGTRYGFLLDDELTGNNSGPGVGFASGLLTNV
jgi:hypothetical protein